MSLFIYGAIALVVLRSLWLLAGGIEEGMRQ